MLTGDERDCAAALLRQEAREVRNDIWLCIAFSCSVTVSSLRVRLWLSDSTLDNRLASDAFSSLS
jgi:hypothetical protein